MCYVWGRNGGIKNGELKGLWEYSIKIVCLSGIYGNWLLKGIVLVKSRFNWEILKGNGRFMVGVE